MNLDIEQVAERFGCPHLAVKGQDFYLALTRGPQFVSLCLGVIKGRYIVLSPYKIEELERFFSREGVRWVPEEFILALMTISSRSVDFFVRVALPWTLLTPQGFETLSKSRFRAEVAKREDLPESLAIQLANDPDLEVRQAVMDNPNLPWEYKVQLMGDEPNSFTGAVLNEL